MTVSDYFEKYSELLNIFIAVIFSLVFYYGIVGTIVYHTGLAEVTDGHGTIEEEGKTEDESATTYINSDQTKKGQPKRKVHLRMGGSRKD